MSSTDSDQDAAEEYRDELENIKNVIGLIRDNIDALNAKFADYPASELPTMYVEEYQELTTKLHDLEIKQQLLSEKLQKNDTPDQTDQATEVRMKKRKWQDLKELHI